MYYQWSKGQKSPEMQFLVKWKVGNGTRVNMTFFAAFHH